MLWNKTDATLSRPTWLNTDNLPAGTQIIYVDATEAAAASNRSKGIKSPGWYTYLEYTNSNGDVRYKTELLVAVVETAALAGDAAADLFVPDVSTTVTISVQPTAQTAVAGAATFSVTAAVSPAGTATYQWQSKTAASSKWSTVAGATAASLVLAGQTVANSGDQYRVVVAGAGAKAVTSTAAALTVAA